MTIKLKNVYAISDLSKPMLWSKVGVAILGSGDVLNVKLDLLPLSGQLRIGEPADLRATKIKRRIP
jgi:hypothetical protein